VPTSLFLVALFVAGPPDPQATEVVADIQVRGNVATPDEEVVRLAGIAVGMPVGPDTVATVTERLRRTQCFERVDVLKRYGSLSDPTRIVLVLLVDEGPVTIRATGDPSRPTRVTRRRSLNLLFLPVLSGEDGYGLTYGVLVSRPDLAGANTRLSISATWGGEKRAGAELEKRFESGPLDRIEVGAAISSRRNPFFREDAQRRAAWGRGERQLFPALKVGASTDWQRLSFLGTTDYVVSVGADAVLDTRLDPWLARNATYVRTAWTRIGVRDREASHRFQVDARGYLGVAGQAVLVARILRDGADRPLPKSLQPILGGTANLRGFRTGTAVGDNLVSGSLELRVPLTSPVRIGQIGAIGFVDTGTVYDAGERLEHQQMRSGVGAGIWIGAAFARLNVAVARGRGSSTRVHVSGGVTF
jgi:outer membrane protein assembly factor BamA